MKEIKAAEIRGVSNDTFSTVDEQQQHDSDAEDGSFMVQIPKSVSKTNIVEPNYMSEVRRLYRMFCETMVEFKGCLNKTETLEHIF